MMRIQLFAAIVFAGAVATAVDASAQSLAEVARQEAERRRAARGAGKIYTNGDLVPVALPVATPSGPVQSPPNQARAGSPGRTPAAPGAPVAGSAADAGQPVPPVAGAVRAEAPVEDESYWRKRLQTLRDQVERDESYGEAMQSRINALTTDFTNRDDPAQRASIGVARQKALADLNRLHVAIAAGRQAIADLQEEARRAGAPAGWLR